LFTASLEKVRQTTDSIGIGLLLIMYFSFSIMLLAGPYFHSVIS
jgi:hypothetical protein